MNAKEVDKKVSFYMKGLYRCNQHQELIEFFCEDENQLCCSTCAIVDHRKCNSVVDIQKVAGKPASESSSLQVKFQEVKKKVEIILNSIASSKETLDKDVKEIPVTIRRMRDTVIKMFDELEVSVVKDAECFQTETLKKMAKKQSQNEKYLADIQSCLKTVDYMYQNRTAVQRFIIEQKMKEEVNVLQTKVDAECQDLETVTVTFDFDYDLSLPPLPINYYIPGQLNVKSHLSVAASTVSLDVAKMTLTPVMSVDLKKSQDDTSEPLYTGIDLLPDGRLVAVDKNNKKCLVYNEKLEKVGSYQLSYPPQSVVVVSEQEVAIIYHYAYRIDILHVSKSNDITLDWTYKVTKLCDSICHKDGGQFVVGTRTGLKPILIISSTGKEKDFNINFPKDRHCYEESACTYIRNSDKLVLTKRWENTVTIYDVKTNTRVVVYDYIKIPEPLGAAVGPSDTILVCCKNSIVQISQTGRILSSCMINMTHPIRFCVSCDKSFLVVTNVCVGLGVDLCQNQKIQKYKIACQ